MSKEHKEIVWKDVRLGTMIGNEHVQFKHSGGLDFGGAIIFQYKTANFYVPLGEDVDTTSRLSKIGPLGEAIVRNIAQLLGVDEITVSGNYSMRISFGGVYTWRVQRKHVLCAIREACEKHGFSLGELSSDTSF